MPATYFGPGSISRSSKYMMSQDFPPSIRITDTSNFQIMAMIMREKISFRTPLIFSESRNPSIDHSEICAYVFPSFGRQPSSYRSSFSQLLLRGDSSQVPSFKGGNIWTFYFVGLFVLLACPYCGSLHGGFTSRRFFSFSLASSHVFILSASFYHFFDSILQLDAVIGVVVVAFVASTVF